MVLFDRGCERCSVLFEDLLLRTGEFDSRFSWCFRKIFDIMSDCLHQGMMLLRVTSDEKSWNLNMGEIARGWKGGCIIRAKFLDRIRSAFSKNPDLSSLLLDDRLTYQFDLSRSDGYSSQLLIISIISRIHHLFRSSLIHLQFCFSFSKELRDKQTGWRRAVVLAQQEGIAVPALSASLAYFDAYSSAQVQSSNIEP